MYTAFNWTRHRRQIILMYVPTYVHTCTYVTLYSTVLHRQTDSRAQWEFKFGSTKNGRITNIIRFKKMLTWFDTRGLQAIHWSNWRQTDQWDKRQLHQQLHHHIQGDYHTKSMYATCRYWSQDLYVQCERRQPRYIAGEWATYHCTHEQCCDW